MSVIFTETNYDTVVAELKRRGLFDGMMQCKLPNRTIANSATREIFYVQDDPRLAGWAKYSTDSELQEAFKNFTVRRCGPKSRIEEISITASHDD